MKNDAFANTVVWITGGGTGLGRAMAEEFARLGADVAVSGRRVDRLADAVAAIEKLGRRGVAVACDVTDEDSVRNAVAEVVAKLGRLDVAVANAGFSVAGRIEKIDAATWRRQLDTNVVGAAITARHAIPELLKTRGRLALVGSVAGMISTPGVGPYHASKYAVRAIGQTLAIELYGSGVSVTTLSPGFVESEIAQVDNAGVHDPSRRDARPAQLMWKTPDAARVMVRAIYRRKRDYIFTAHGRFAAFIGRHCPGLVHFIFTRTSAGYKRRDDA